EGLYATGRGKHVACWAHARRKVVETQGSAASAAQTAREFIRRLYAVEKDRRKVASGPENASPRQQQRDAQAPPILEEFRGWLEQHSPAATPKSPLGEAIRYALKNWETLGRYREHSYRSIDNNLSERTLRPGAVGRKNGMFWGSVEGGRTAAVLYRVVGTCKPQGIDPFA
ncbi:MAG TPA: transposase, partial [Gemmataceae bacterium]|nr:transposase [Gemmataceae bacterium]